MKKYLALPLSFFLLVSCSSVKKPYTEEMKSNLEKMFKMDQDVQSFDLKRTQDQKYIDSMNIASERIYRENTEIVKKYFKDYSLPTVRENGQRTSILFWVFVQHADHDVAFQAEVLKVMTKELKKGNVLKNNYAYLYDRVHKNQGKPQRYGTQISWETGAPAPYSLEQPEKINELRKEMGLESMEDYLRTMKN